MSDDTDHADDAMTVLRSLSRYLLAHPLASDTSDGIASWWLHIDPALHESALGSALRRLIELQLIEEIGGPDGRIRYRRIPGARSDAALAALAAKGWPRPDGNESTSH